jgi:hypothetical protein
MAQQQSIGELISANARKVSEYQAIMEKLLDGRYEKLGFSLYLNVKVENPEAQQPMNPLEAVFFGRQEPKEFHEIWSPVHVLREKLMIQLCRGTLEELEAERQELFQKLGYKEQPQQSLIVVAR